MYQTAESVDLLALFPLFEMSRAATGGDFSSAGLKGRHALFAEGSAADALPPTASRVEILAAGAEQGVGQGAGAGRELALCSFADWAALAPFAVSGVLTLAALFGGAERKAAAAAVVSVESADYEATGCCRWSLSAGGGTATLRGPRHGSKPLRATLPRPGHGGDGEEKGVLVAAEIGVGSMRLLVGGEPFEESFFTASPSAEYSKGFRVPRGALAQSMLCVDQKENGVSARQLHVFQRKLTEGEHEWLGVTAGGELDIIRRRWAEGSDKAGGGGSDAGVALKSLR